MAEERRTVAIPRYGRTLPVMHCANQEYERTRTFSRMTNARSPQMNNPAQ